MTRPKAEKLEAQGDALMAQGKPARALEKYRAAEAVPSDHAELYTKLIAAHQAATTEWTEADFSQSLAWEMRRQELEHPAVKATHERLAPEWQQVTELLQRLIATPDHATELELVDRILQYETKALRPLLDCILAIKHGPAASETRS